MPSADSYATNISGRYQARCIRRPVVRTAEMTGTLYFGGSQPRNEVAGDIEGFHMWFGLGATSKSGASSETPFKHHTLRRR